MTGPLKTDQSALLARRPRVTIALATFNGAAHLQDQLASIVAQDNVDWDLWVSDDGSTDGTVDLLAEFAAQHTENHAIVILDGPRKGSAANFLSLMTHPDLPKSQPIALADQDDVWRPEKLGRALDVIATLGDVALYSAQSLHTDANLIVTGQSNFPRHPPSFQNALVQNIVSGHSTVISPGGLELIRSVGQPMSVPFHDWWLYLLFTGAGADVHIDMAQTVYYRQHHSNALGAHHGIAAKLLRLKQVFGRTYGSWIRHNLSALAAARHVLTDENAVIVDLLTHTRNKRISAHILHEANIHRQDLLSDKVLYAAARFGRI